MAWDESWEYEEIEAYIHALGSSCKASLLMSGYFKTMMSFRTKLIGSMRSVVGTYEDRTYIVSWQRSESHTRSISV